MGDECLVETARPPSAEVRRAQWPRGLTAPSKRIEEPAAQHAFGAYDERRRRIRGCSRRSCFCSRLGVRTSRRLRCGAVIESRLESSREEVKNARSRREGKLPAHLLHTVEEVLSEKRAHIPSERRERRVERTPLVDRTVLGSLATTLIHRLVHFHRWVLINRWVLMDECEEFHVALPVCELLR